MLPLRLVIDTNVVVSAALKPEAQQRTSLALALTKPAHFYVSCPILEEYGDVLSRQELGIRKGMRQLLQLIKNHSHLVKPSRRLEAGDPDDNIFLECADAASGLSHCRQSETPSEILEETKVITTREFPSLVAPHLIK